VLQLEKTYGKGKDAKDFIAQDLKGALDRNPHVTILCQNCWVAISI
jgi:hypothetical protein